VFICLPVCLSFWGKDV
jgi:hypothetical protein